jgi:DNA polymerase III epsilon subunit family exonuclease
MTDKLNLSLPWQESNFTVLDLEGTGAQHKENEGIVEIAAIQISGKQLTDIYYYKLLNPQIEIPPMISRIHGLKNKDVENEPIFDSIKIELLDFINDKILVGHNVNVDYRLLKLKMPTYTPPLILDTKKLSKQFWPNESKHGLDDLIVRFQIQHLLADLPVKRNRHSAFYDAYATGIVFIKMLQEKIPYKSLKQVADICKIDSKSSENNQTSLF